jgi:hypothetical protein
MVAIAMVLHVDKHTDQKFAEMYNSPETQWCRVTIDKLNHENEEGGSHGSTSKIRSEMGTQLKGNGIYHQGSGELGAINPGRAIGPKVSPDGGVSR